VKFKFHRHRKENGSHLSTDGMEATESYRNFSQIDLIRREKEWEFTFVLNLFSGIGNF
jgi:hypothetical protein